MMRARLATCTLWALTACADSPDPPGAGDAPRSTVEGAARCQSHSDCPTGMSCVRGRCELDAGPGAEDGGAGIGDPQAPQGEGEDAGDGSDGAVEGHDTAAGAGEDGGTATGEGEGAGLGEGEGEGGGTATDEGEGAGLGEGEGEGEGEGAGEGEGDADASAPCEAAAGLMGDPCRCPDECANGLCLDTAPLGDGVGVCTRECVSDNACPAAHLCYPSPALGEWVCHPNDTGEPCAGPPDCNLALCLDARPHVAQPRCSVPCHGGQVCPVGTACGLAVSFRMDPVFACIPEGAQCQADSDCLFGVCAPDDRCAAQCRSWNSDCRDADRCCPVARDDGCHTTACTAGECPAPPPEAPAACGPQGGALPPG